MVRFLVPFFGPFLVFLFIWNIRNGAGFWNRSDSLCWFALSFFFFSAWFENEPLSRSSFGNGAIIWQVNALQGKKSCG